MFKPEILLLLRATWETLYMVFIASSISVPIGLALGVFLFFSKQTGHWKLQTSHHAVGVTINIVRSIPFIILLILLLPLTRLLVGTTIGTNAAIIPLTIAAIPFYARISESAFAEVPQGLLESGYAFGASKWHLIQKVLIPESLPALIRGIALTVIGLVGYSAMAGTIGGGGLGELAVNYGYQRYDMVVTLETIVVLVLLVQLIQSIGDYLAEKRQLKPLLYGVILLFACCIFSQASSFLQKPQQTIRVGVMSGYAEDVIAVAAKRAQKDYQLKIEIVTFTDYGLPNQAVADGSIDANIFQHLPYLDEQNKLRQLGLKPIGKTFVYPMGFYSTNIKTISELKPKAVVALPNDPSNQARALILLAKYKLIELKQVSSTVSVRDVTANPKHLQFKLLDAAQIPRALPDVSLAAITNDYLPPTGLTLQEALLKEGSDSLYANIIVVRPNEVHNENLEHLVAVMHSPEVEAETLKIFPHGAAIPAWK